MSKVLSVSVAAYNVENTLAEALEPFCKSNHKDLLDIMIVNDQSTDTTAQVAQKYVDMYPDTFRLINKENGGWGSTVNKGIELAKGKYFKQLDGDDYFSVENLDDFIDFLQKVDSDFVYSPFVSFNDADGSIINILGAYPNFDHGELLYLSEVDFYLPAMHTLTCKTDILQENNITVMEHCFYTDVEYSIKAVNHSERFSYYARPIYYYRTSRDGQSMSVSGIKKHYKDHERVVFAMIDYCNTSVNKPYLKNIIQERVVDLCHMQYAFYFVLPPSVKYKRECESFDLKLSEYPYYYSKGGRFVKLLRKNKFKFYILLAYLKNLLDKKKKLNIYAE